MMISGSAYAHKSWFPDSGSLYASPSSAQSSSFASTQPSPAMMALKPESKMISPQYATSSIPTLVTQSFQHQKLEKFVQSALCAASGGGGIERIRPAKRRPRPVPEEKKDEVKIKNILLQLFFYFQAYKERRRKNNDSARRSREQRRRKEDEIQQRNNELERENARLRQEINILRFEVLQLRQYCYGIVGGNVGETINDARII
uniref:BZIP domain-containing protein n=1 Tax=Meloidogyne hapla TaxID=6305 RepID=A0A1I8AZW7_MELHA